ncbi:unnamed protein product [Echinostoma caproni]|uniref:Ig-like domain-containing protein n=1 Tax=Echinostoma caproni TaxID=27848 RepID=A0A183B815_9TREM|nr:unnamed protein product [Echinostoma caproni]
MGRETACAKAVTSSSHELVYLAPMSERSVSTVTNPKTLQTVESAIQSGRFYTRPTWPVQLVQYQSSGKSPTICYYNVVTLDGSYTDFSFGSPDTANISAPPDGGSTCTDQNDFLMVIRNSIVLHNQLPISVNYVVAEVSKEIDPGSHATLRTVLPTKSVIIVWFDYDGRVYRGKLELSSTMDELTVCTFESREGYELLTLHLGLRSVTAMGQTALMLYAPYWMINKTGRNLTYKVCLKKRKHWLFILFLLHFYYALFLYF